VDPQRFDSLAKRLGTRLTRRDAIRAGAGAALGAMTLAKLAPTVAQDPGTTYKDRFISIRTYPYTGSIDDAAAALQGLVTLMEQQPGFISIDFVDGDDEIHIVATFLDKASAVVAAKQEDDWIAANAASILSGKPQINSGKVFLRSELGTQCGCTTGVEHPCSSDDLVCCPTAGILDGGPGICLTAVTTCPAQEAAPPPTSAPVEPTEAPPTEIPACTSEGCDCISGTEGACDAGLVCCGTGEPGSPGTCLIDCGGGGCTSDGCACIAGTEGACDEGLECCAGEPGGEGICQASCEPASVCPGGEGCDCTSDAEGACDEGLFCCGVEVPGGSGICGSACA
jgi:hypothetical protein